MIIYKDVITDDEIISDTWKVVDVGDGLWEIDGKTITVGGDTFVLDGANPSAEEGDEDAGGDSTTEQKLDLAHSFRWVSVPRPDKKLYQADLKKYCKAVLEKLKSDGKDEEAKAFQSTAPAAMKKILGNYNNWDMYVGESMAEISMYVLVDYREDGVTPYATVWRYGLKEMKV